MNDNIRRFIRMDLRLLEIFCKVYEERSFSKAGKKLYLTQPTVSGHIKTLERCVGAKLLDRLNKEIRPTQAGILLYSHGRQIVDAKRALVEEMGRFLNGLEGQLNLGASTIPGEYLLAPMIGSFREAHPRIDVSLVIRDTAEIINSLLASQIEAGFVGISSNDHNLCFEEFATDRLVLVAPNVDPWRKIDSLSLDQLRKVPLILREEGSATRRVFEKRLNEVGSDIEDFRVVAELGSTSAIKQGVQVGVGLSFVSDLSVTSELEFGRLKRILVPELGDVVRRFYMALHARRARSPLCEAFLSFMQVRQRLAS